MAKERRARAGSEPFPEPDMLPLMNIILMLILAMITMAALLPLGLLSSEAQRLSSGGFAAEKVEEKKPLNLTVFMTESGFNISVYGEVKMGEIDPSKPDRKLPLIANIPGPDGKPEYNYQALQEKLTEFKKLDKDEESVTLTADPEVIFDAVVKTMDAARFDAEKQILFPRVSFAAGLVG
jgi:biopolymer transport protein ExbD